MEGRMGVRESHGMVPALVIGDRPTLDSLQLGSTEGHRQVERNVVLVVAHSHEEVEFHLCKHL